MVSTDSVRHMMRGFVSDKENPLLWASTYHAGECLDLELVAEAKAKKKEAKQASLPLHTSSGGSNGTLTTAQSLTNNRGNGSDTDEKGMNVSLEKQPNLRPDGRVRLEHAESLVGAKTMAVEGFKAQSEMVMDSLDRLITAWEGKKESVVVEGVHLSLNFVVMISSPSSIFCFIPEYVLFSIKSFYYSMGLLVGSWSYCIQYLFCLVSFSCTLGGSGEV